MLSGFLLFYLLLFVKKVPFKPLTHMHWSEKDRPPHILPSCDNAAAAALIWNNV